MLRAHYDPLMRALLVPLLLLCGACPPPTSSTATTAATSGGSGSSTSTTGDACAGASDCESEGICVAEYSAESLGGERGPARCEDPSLCIQALDLGRWCFEHPSCCEGLRCRKVDGICEVPDFGESTTGTGTSTGTSTSTSTTGDDTGSTSQDSDTDTGGTGTDTDTGTSTGP